jgi:hypothetical protein
MTTTTTTTNGWAAFLAEPFAADEIHWKPAVVSGNRCLAIAYIDARAIQDRLDTVLGPEGWSDEYQLLPDGSVVCRLTCRFGELTVTKSDVGSPSEQKDEGDRMKAAFSDALKRAAVKFGIGRYLYRLGGTWADYDAQRKQIAKPPALPSWALPSNGANGISLGAHVAPKLSTDDPEDIRLTPDPAPSKVTDAQALELRHLLREAGADLRKFLDHFKVATIADLPEVDYTRAVRMLQRKKAGAAARNGKADDAAGDNSKP